MLYLYCAEEPMLSLLAQVEEPAEGDIEVSNSTSEEFSVTIDPDNEAGIEVFVGQKVMVPFHVGVPPDTTHKMEVRVNVHRFSGDKKKHRKNPQNCIACYVNLPEHWSLCTCFSPVKTRDLTETGVILRGRKCPAINCSFH